jgi:hypothetical protein
MVLMMTAAILDVNMPKEAGRCCFSPKATGRVGSSAPIHTDVYIVIATVNFSVYIHLRLHRSAAQNNRVFMTAQCSRLINFLITEKYIGIVGQASRFKV